MTEVKDAVKNLKTIGSELTVWENRLEVAKSELQRVTQARDALQAEIDKKSSDYSVYIAQRDAENKKAYSDIAAQRDQLNKDKAEFQNILKQHQIVKATLDQDKQALDIQKLRFDATTKNVQEFITAVRRASGLLGI
jgi:hypothetical protein